MIKRLKKTLKRKFELTKISIENQSLVLGFNLQNFVYFDKNKLFLEIDGTKNPLIVDKKSNNYIEVKIKLKYVIEKGNRFTFSYRNKKLWVVPSENLNHILEVSNKIYIIKIDKDIFFNKYKTNFNFVNQHKKVEIQYSDNNYIGLKTDDKVEFLILMNQSEQIEIPMFDKKINLETIKEQINEGSYKVYLVANQTIYLAQFINSKPINYMIMKYEWINNYLYASLNDLSVQQMNLASMANESLLRISIDTENINLDAKYEFKSLGIIDIDLNNMRYLNTKCYNSQINSELNLNEFYNTKNKKIIAIFQEKNSNSEIFYCLNSKNNVKFKGYYYFENQIFNFNIKNKNGITIINSKPKIKVGLNSLSEDILNLYFLPSSIYKTFQYYLTFEERLSQNKYEIKISTGEQDIGVPYEEIENLKTTSKNIIDIFISIYDGENLIRKEKIKYSKGIYKKDNYLTLKTKTLNKKKTFYMFTLTPFKNIKIESFELTLENYKILENGNKSNDVWLIGERTDTAQDNGIQFFKWLQHNTNIKSYYVIDEDSNDYNKVKHLENVIVFGSKQHFEISAQANVLISTHDLENILPYKTAENFWGYEKSIRIFLQHGVLGRKKVEYDKDNYDLPFHLFNVSSTEEKYDIVVNQLGYKPENVAVTGLPRFDNLPLESEGKTKKILIMPTWRDWLNSDYAFENSEYMKKYKDLINHPKFAKLIQKYNIEVNFYPHYRAQSFFKNHLDNSKGLINYVHLGEQTVQDLLIEHDILITDYSSVSFDFSYMKKPVIFFHFDVERFFRKGILRPIEESFIGDIVYNEETMLDKIEDIINSKNKDFTPDLSNIFDFIDHKNSERVYCEILKKIETEY